MNKKKEIWFIVFTLVLCVLLFAERLTGNTIHSILGLIVVVVMDVHLFMQLKKLKHKKQQIQAVDWLLVASVEILFVTGILLHPMREVLALKIVHKLAAVLFVIGIIVHIIQHRRKSHVS